MSPGRATNCASARHPLRTLLPLALITTCLKLLLLRAPYSTDLHVHRHWKSLTLHQPLHKWYTDSSSQWTLDYPPLFAYFEYILSHLLTFLHPSLTSPNPSPPTQTHVTLLRLTVILLDPLLLYCTYQLATATHRSSSSSSRAAVTFHAALPFLLPALTLVDTIHFQYNVLPLSLLLLCLAHLTRRNLHLGAALFSLCLNLKHTLLPLTPPIAVYLLSAVRHTPRPLHTFLTLALTTTTALILPWLPLLHSATHIPALSRMFPFHRGLLHANWAPNLWSPYAALDLTLTRLGLALRTTTASTTSGIIHNTRPFAVLPNPTPLLCILLTLTLTAPFLPPLTRPSATSLTRAVAAAALASFLAGWHVHEKAVLLPLLPLSFVHPEPFVWLSLAAHLALLELLRHPAIAPFLVAHFVAFHAGLFAMWRVPRGAGLYFVGCLLVEAYAGLLRGHWFLFDGMQFLPILVVSLYSFIGVAVAYAILLHQSWTREKDD